MKRILKKGRLIRWIMMLAVICSTLFSNDTFAASNSTGNNVPSNIHIDGATYPTTIVETSHYKVQGVVKSNYTIQEVAFGVFDLNWNRETEATINPNSKTYDFSKDHNAVKFEKLKPGTYHYTVWVKDEGMTQGRCLVDVCFKVIDKNSSISITGPTNPGTITQGGFFANNGKIESWYNLSSVTIEICDTSWNKVIAKTVYPNVTTYSLNNSTINSAINLGSLAPGFYHYCVWASNNVVTKCLQDVGFTVKEKVVTPSSNYDSKVMNFLSDSRWKPGVWYGASQAPKISSYKGKGCCAYAADFVKYVFDKDAPTSGKAFHNPADIRAGDVIKVLDSQHWFVVLYRNGSVLTTVEGNWTDGKALKCTQYSVSGNTLLRNGKKFRTFSVGYHFM